MTEKICDWEKKGIKEVDFLSQLLSWMEYPNDSTLLIVYF